MWGRRWIWEGARRGGLGGRGGGWGFRSCRRLFLQWGFGGFDAVPSRTRCGSRRRRPRLACACRVRRGCGRGAAMLRFFRGRILKRA